ELPAGTLDVDGEAPQTAAQRELREEGDVDAASWRLLLHMTASPGYSSELWQVFEARQLHTVPAGERTRRGRGSRNGTNLGRRRRGDRGGVGRPHHRRANGRRLTGP